MMTEHVDVLIVGAGISGIAAAYHLQTSCPNKTYTILEGRDAIGGTWDLFRYPGVRSDSDMFTLGYSFHPWPNAKAIADGPSILKYVRDTAAKYGIDRDIRFNHRVCGASWSSEDGLWTVDVQRTDHDDTVQFTCNFLFMCTGYYDYEKGYTPDWDGMDRYQGRIIHPQHWPEDFDYTGKRIIVIGSGATAVTVVPAMAEDAEHVTMLQRSPTYMVARPAEDATINKIRRYLPTRLAYALARWRMILLRMWFYRIARTKPDAAKKVIIQDVQALLGSDYDVETHFTPSYKPWDQRMCLVPDADLFRTINDGSVSIVTDHIDCFTENGIQLKSGKTLEADVIVTATGFTMKLMVGVQLIVDGEPIDLGNTVSYKGMMYSNIPNLASAFGYTNESWTLKAELICKYVCRLLHHMDQHDYDQCRPVHEDPTMAEDPILDFTSGYVQRALDSLPKQGSERPWRVYQNYIMDMFTMKFGTLDDGVMRFTKRQQP